MDEFREIRGGRACVELQGDRAVPGLGCEIDCGPAQLLGLCR